MVLFECSDAERGLLLNVRARSIISQRQCKYFTAQDEWLAPPWFVVLQQGLTTVEMMASYLSLTGFPGRATPSRKGHLKRTLLVATPLKKRASVALI